MTTPLDDRRTALYSRIVGALENGGQLTDAILEYIDASLFSPTPDRLAVFLTGVDGESERDSLLDLIFYPEPAVQIELEPLLEAAGFSPDDAAALHDRLQARVIHARIHMPDGGRVASIPVPDFVKSQYLERLNITWHLDPEVAAAIDNGVSEAVAPIVKVRLRNANLRLIGNRRRFLGRFFEWLRESDPDYLACLDLVLPLLGSAGEAADVYDLLTTQKQALFRSFQQARRFDALLRQANMETLMLQGVRAPHAPPVELMRRMRLIDRLCLGIFGKTESFAMPVEAPLRVVADLDNPAAAIRSLLP